MPETFTPSLTEWNQLTVTLMDAVSRLKQAEAFNAEMDKRQAKVETDLTDRTKRMESLELWRGSANATMTWTEKKVAAVDAELPKLRAEDAGIIARLKPLESAKPQLEGAVAGLKSAVDAQARVDDVLRTDLNKQADRLTLTDAKVSAMQAVDSVLADRLNALEAWKPKVDEANTKQDERLTKLEAPKVVEVPTEPKEPTV